MEKIIHYCWFGDKKMPKLARKCLKSWKKYLPDYEIMVWSEKNFDYNMTPFSKAAYANKKWAFVSDVARIYALKEYGGIYFDTDMLLKKDIKFLEEDNFFAGWESESYVAVGVLGAKKGHPIINELWKYYLENSFDMENMFMITIPIILTRILKKEYSLKNNCYINQKLKDGVNIYARDYFYPLSSDFNSKPTFTDNTCMIHYYNGTWLNKTDQLIGKFERMFGKRLGRLLLRSLVYTKKVITYPKRRRAYKSSLKLELEKYKQEIDNEFKNIKKPPYLAFCNKNWIGTTIATTTLFNNNTIKIKEIFNPEIEEYLIDKIIKTKTNFLIFSGFAEGWNSLIRKINERNKKIKIKVIWHGSICMNIEDYDYSRFIEIINLHNEKIISSIAFVKKSSYEFFKKKKFNVEFLMNNIALKNDYKIIDKKNDKEINIGLYASGDRWVKNFYNQLSATSLIDNCVVECIPLSYKSLAFAEMLNIKIKGQTSSVSREELLKKLAANSINLYVTFTECAPLLPLESFEMGVPCITSNNHHYWNDTPLEEYLIVNENDDPIKIYEKILFCLENKEKVMKLYNEWKKKYNKECEKNLKNFLK